MRCSHSPKTSHSQPLILKLSILVKFFHILLVFSCVCSEICVLSFPFYLTIVVFHVFYTSDETFYLSYCFTTVLLNLVFLQEVFDTLLTCWPLVFKAVSVMKSIWWKMLSVQYFYLLLLSVWHWRHLMNDLVSICLYRAIIFRDIWVSIWLSIRQ